MCKSFARWDYCTYTIACNNKTWFCVHARYCMSVEDNASYSSTTIFFKFIFKNRNCHRWCNFSHIARIFLGSCKNPIRVSQKSYIYKKSSILWRRKSRVRHCMISRSCTALQDKSNSSLSNTRLLFLKDTMLMLPSRLLYGSQHHSSP